MSCPVNPLTYRSRMCSYGVECRAGEDCAFAHSSGQLRARPVPQAYKTRSCGKAHASVHELAGCAFLHEGEFVDEQGFVVVRGFVVARIVRVPGWW